MSFLCKSWGEPMPPSPKPTKKVGFFSTLASVRYHMSLSFCFFLAAESLKTSKSNDHKQLPKHQSRHHDHLFLPALGKNISINWLARQSLNLKGYSPWRPLPRGFPNRWGFGPDELCSDSWFFGHPWITKYARSRFGVEFPPGFEVQLLIIPANLRNHHLLSRLFFKIGWFFQTTRCPKTLPNLPCKISTSTPHFGLKNLVGA